MIKINTEDELEHIKIGEKIYRILKKAILDGDLKSGQKLNQDELAETLKVSRTPIREALLKLEKEQLVENLPYKGAVVSKFSLRKIRECHEIRAVLEGYAAKIAAKNISKNKLDKLKKLIEEMKAYKNNIERVISLNDEFHKLICNASGNERLYYIVESMLKHFPRNISWNLPGRVKSTIKEHEKVLEAIEKRESGKAEKLMMKHLHSVEASCVKTTSGEKAYKT